MCHTNFCVWDIGKTPKTTICFDLVPVRDPRKRPSSNDNYNGAKTRRQLQTDSTCPPSFAAAYIPRKRWGSSGAKRRLIGKKTRERNPLFMAFFKDPKKTLEKNEGILSTLKNIHIIHGTDWYIYLDEVLIFMVNGVANIAVTLRIWHKNEAFTKKPVR